MRTQIIIAAAILLTGQIALAANPVSWGKAGISYDQYRDDAKKCTLAGLDAELKQKPPPFWGSGTSTTLDDFLTQNEGSDAVMARLRTDAAILQIRTCLKRQGYQQFRLTDTQTDHLRTLTRGTEERHQYLYSLAHDTGVLGAQALKDGEE